MRCAFIKSNKKQCCANAMRGEKFCFTHNPAKAKEKMAAVIKGGKALKRNHTSLPSIPLEGARDVSLLLAKTINEVRAGAIELRVANCVGYLSGHLLKAIEISDLEERIAKIEKAIDKKI